jgi:HAD superfamily hydrolase (TIGR01458 family)
VPSAFLLDLAGTLYADDGPIPGAVAAVARLRQEGRPHRFVTNTSSRSRGAIVERLRNYGFDVGADDTFTAVVAGADIAMRQGAHMVAPFVDERTLADLGQFELVGGTSGQSAAGYRPEAVIVGDLGDRWNFHLMQEAFRFLMDGATLIAMSRDRYWHRGDGLTLDAGAFVTGLEYAASTEAQIAGKPSPGFFHAALQSMGLPVERAGECAMVGDDLWSDVGGAQQAGLEGWLVRTGKFRPEILDGSDITPDRVIDSVVDILND